MPKQKLYREVHYIQSANKSSKSTSPGREKKIVIKYKPRARQPYQLYARKSPALFLPSIYKFHSALAHEKDHWRMQQERNNSARLYICMQENPGYYTNIQVPIYIYYTYRCSVGSSGSSRGGAISDLPLLAYLLLLRRRRRLHLQVILDDVRYVRRLVADWLILRSCATATSSAGGRASGSAAAVAADAAAVAADAAAGLASGFRWGSRHALDQRCLLHGGVLLREEDGGCNRRCRWCALGSPRLLHEACGESTF